MMLYGKESLFGQYRSPTNLLCTPQSIHLRGKERNGEALDAG